MGVAHALARKPLWFKTVEGNYFYLISTDFCSCSEFLPASSHEYTHFLFIDRRGSIFTIEKFQNLNVWKVLH